MNRHQERIEALYNLVDQLPRKGGQVPEEVIESSLTFVKELREEAQRDVIRNNWRMEEFEEKERLRNERLEKQDKQRTLDIERGSKLYGKGGTNE